MVEEDGGANPDAVESSAAAIIIIVARLLQDVIISLFCAVLRSVGSL